jgi:hypothetical protein
LPQLSKNAGLNRFTWDLRYDSPPALNFSYYGNMLDYVEYTLSDHAIPEDTPREQTLGPLAVPGQYELTLIANDVLMKQPLSIVLDPRVHVSQADLEAQLVAGKRINAGLASSYNAYRAIAPVRDAVADRQKSVPGSTPPPPMKDLADALKDFSAKTNAVVEGSSGAPGIGPLHRDLARTAFMIQSGDAAPSSTAAAELGSACAALNKDFAAWRELASQALPAVNALLEKYKFAPLPIPEPSATATSDACHE